MDKTLREEAFLRFKKKRMKEKTEGINQTNNTEKTKMTLREKYHSLRKRLEKVEEKVDKVYNTFK